MAARKGQMCSHQKKANRSRDNDRLGDVSIIPLAVEDSPEDERQSRERLAGYFAILREWDQRLTQNESQEVPEFHQP
jgi:hypothetical protein